MDNLFSRLNSLSQKHEEAQPQEPINEQVEEKAEEQVEEVVGEVNEAKEEFAAIKDKDAAIKALAMLFKQGTAGASNQAVDLINKFKLDGNDVKKALKLVNESTEVNEEEIVFFICEECGEMYETNEACECGGELCEAVKVVVRDGKVQKKQVNKRKKKLSAKQKAALAKARKKAHSSDANKARAKSMKLRKKKVHEEEEFDCPACDFVGPMEEIEEGVFLCPECGAELEIAEEQVEEVKQEATIEEGLKVYLEALEVPQEVIDKGTQEIVEYLKSEYGVEPVL